jgi:hypothetical protein
MIAHLAWRTDTGLRYVEVWQSKDDYEAFAGNRLHLVVHPILRDMLGFVPPEPAHTMLDVIDAWTDRHPALPPVPQQGHGRPVTIHGDAPRPCGSGNSVHNAGIDPVGRKSAQSRRLWFAEMAADVRATAVPRVAAEDDAGLFRRWSRA